MINKSLPKNSLPINFLCDRDIVLKNIIIRCGDLDYSLYEDYFDFLVYTIIGQMLSNKIGDQLYDRLVNKLNGKLTPEAIKNLGVNNVKEIGISTRKASAIVELSCALLKNPNYLTELSKLEDKIIIDSLCKIKGIGLWTIKMFLIFCLDKEDILPVEDGAFIAAFKIAYNFVDDTRNKKYISEYCQKWRPYSSYAARYLYKAYDRGMLVSK